MTNYLFQVILYSVLLISCKDRPKSDFQKTDSICWDTTRYSIIKRQMQELTGSHASHLKTGTSGILPNIHKALPNFQIAGIGNPVEILLKRNH